MEEQDGTTFLYVVKKGDRYYTLGNPRYTEFKEVDSVFAVDITEYYDAQTDSFSGISDNVNIGAMQYQMSAGSYMQIEKKRKPTWAFFFWNSNILAKFSLQRLSYPNRTASAYSSG